MEERCDAAPITRDVARDARPTLVVELVAVVPDEVVALGQPVDDLERRVAERSRDRVTQALAATECEQQVGDRGARELATQHSGEERDRDGAERRERRE